MKKTSVLVSALMLVVFAVVMTSSVRATAYENNSTTPSAITALLEPSEENVNPVITTVNSTTGRVKPLEVAVTPVDSASLTLPWQYISIAIGVAILSATILVTLVLKRRKHKFSRLRFLSSVVLVGLLMMSIAQAYGEETLSVTTWDLQSTGVPYGIITRDSIDSAGKVWFGTWSNKIGYLDPSTNEIKMWVAPDVTNIATVSVDNFDNVWFADPGKGRIGRLDPSTNFFTIWPMLGVNFGITSLMLISIDSNGNAYFAEPSANKIGRIEPATNQLTEWVIPTDNSMPLNTMVDSNDIVWFTESSGNNIGRLNPNTNELMEWLIPTSNSGPSGLYVAGGQVYFAEVAGGKIGRLNPGANEITQWSLVGLFSTDPKLVGLFVDSNGNAWSKSFSSPPVGDVLVRLDSNNILTYWFFPDGRRISYGGVAIDTQVNVNNIYVSPSYIGFTKNLAILGFHSAA